jgi:hypothetical protein
MPRAIAPEIKYPYPCVKCGQLKERHQFVRDRRIHRGHRLMCSPCSKGKGRIRTRLWGYFQRQGRAPCDQCGEMRTPSEFTRRDCAVCSHCLGRSQPETHAGYSHSMAPVRPLVAAKLGITREQYIAKFMGRLSVSSIDAAWSRGMSIPAKEAVLVVTSSHGRVTFADCGCDAEAKPVRDAMSEEITALHKQGVGPMSIAVRMERQGYHCSVAHVRSVLGLRHVDTSIAWASWDTI